MHRPARGLPVVSSDDPGAVKSAGGLPLSALATRNNPTKVGTHRVLGINAKAPEIMPSPISKKAPRFWRLRSMGDHRVSPLYLSRSRMWSFQKKKDGLF